MSPRLIDKAQLEASLDTLRTLTSDPRAGVFGPESHIWRRQREALVFLGAGRAMMLQTAHPWVAAGIQCHSKSMTDPIGRFHRTFVIVFSMVFGTLDQAFEKARLLHHIHERIHGTMEEAVGPFDQGSPYWANEAEAMLWVHATLWDTSVLMHELVLGPMEPDDLEAYYQETRRFAYFFGIPQEMVPPDWASFQAYVDGVFASGLLSVGVAGREIVDTLFRGKGEKPRPKLPYWYFALTAETVPAHVREGFRVPFGEREQRSAAWARKWAPRVYTRLPKTLRYVPAYREACGRLAGRKGPGFVTRALNLAWVGRSSLVP